MRVRSSSVLKFLRSPLSILRAGDFLPLCLLAIAACGGNYFHLPLFFGVDFLFGGIFVWLATARYGWRWGTCIAFISSLYTIFLWNHPYAVLVFTLEAFVVGFCLRGRQKNLVLFDSFYWLILGLPCAWLFYHQILGAAARPAALIFFKQWTNGISNALLASLLSNYTFLRRWLAGRTDKRPLLSLQEIVFELLVAFCFFPALTIIIFDSRFALQTIEVEVERNLQVAATDVAAELDLWRQRYGGGDRRFLEQLLDAESQALDVSIALLDEEGRVVASNRTYKDGGIARSENCRFPNVRTYQCFPEEKQSVMASWASSVYFYERPVTFGAARKLSIATPAAPYIAQLQNRYIRNLSIVAITSIAALCCASFISRFFARSVRALAEVTTDVPERLSSQKSIFWPESTIAEFSSLIGNFKQMAAALEKQLDDLEEQVGDRTSELEAEIAERQRAEARIRQSQQRLALLVEQTPLAIIEWNLDSTIAAWNPAAAKIFGYSASEAIGQPLVDLIVPDRARSAVRAVVRQIVERAGGSHSTNENLTKDGRTIVCEWYNAPLVASSGETIGVASMALDITDRKHAEMQLQQQTEDLKNALRDLRRAQGQLVQNEKMSSLGRLVAGIAHEINNPVNFIYGNINYVAEYANNLIELALLYRDRYPEPATEVQEYLEEIDFDFLQEDLLKILGSMRAGTDRIREIVLSLRTFSHLDEAECKDVDIREGIESTLTILTGQLKGKGYKPIEIVREYADLPRVECYPGKLNQVFMNLFSNAIDALESLRDNGDGPDPTIRIRTEPAAGGWVKISVANNGPSISAEVQQHLFDPFFTTKPVGKGTGLGLSISYQIVVDLHGGQLSCVSEPGEGVEFAICIPQKRPELKS